MFCQYHMLRYMSKETQLDKCVMPHSRSAGVHVESVVSGRWENSSNLPYDSEVTQIKLGCLICLAKMPLFLSYIQISYVFCKGRVPKKNRQIIHFLWTFGGRSVINVAARTDIFTASASMPIQSIGRDVRVWMFCPIHWHLESRELDCRHGIWKQLYTNQIFGNDLIPAHIVKYGLFVDRTIIQPTV